MLLVAKCSASEPALALLAGARQKPAGGFPIRRRLTICPTGFARRIVNLSTYNRILAFIVGRTPWSAADPLVGLSRIASIWLVEERVQGDPRGPGVRPTASRLQVKTCKRPHSAPLAQCDIMAIHSWNPPGALSAYKAWGLWDVPWLRPWPAPATAKAIRISM